MPAPFPNTPDRCPVCKKTDPIGPGSKSCPRCGCDLAQTAAAHAAARRLTLETARALRAGNPAAALESAARAWTLAHLPEIPPLACLAALHARQLHDLARWRTRTP